MTREEFLKCMATSFPKFDRLADDSAQAKRLRVTAIDDSVASLAGQGGA